MVLCKLLKANSNGKIFQVILGLSVSFGLYCLISMPVKMYALLKKNLNLHTDRLPVFFVVCFLFLL